MTESSVFQTTQTGIASQLAKKLQERDAPTNPQTADWSQIPSHVASLDPSVCDHDAAELLPTTDTGVGVAFIGLKLVVAYPTNPTQAELQVAARCSGREIHAVVLSSNEGFQALQQWSGEQRPAVMVLEDTVKALVDTGAGSDLHLTVGKKPWMRVGGEFKVDATHRLVNETDMTSLINEARSGFQLDDSFDGDLDFSFAAGGQRWRANLAWERGHLVLALRLIPSIIPNARDLGVPARFMAFNNLKQGLVVVAGPTGSGKSTTLAAFLDSINSMRTEHILTLEKPIEFVHPDKKSKITQREIGSDTATLLTGIRSALRQDPDVILVGEARDYEEISAAITLAETGHLVLMTIHAHSAEGVIDRIIDVFPSTQQNQVRTQLGGVLKAVMIQMLLPDAQNPRKRHLCYELMTVNEPMRALLNSGESMKVASEVLSSAQQVSFEDTSARLVADGRVGEKEALASVEDRGFFSMRLKHHKGKNMNTPETPL